MDVKSLVMFDPNCGLKFSKSGKLVGLVALPVTPSSIFSSYSSSYLLLPTVVGTVMQDFEGLQHLVKGNASASVYSVLSIECKQLKSLNSFSLV